MGLHRLAQKTLSSEIPVLLVLLGSSCRKFAVCEIHFAFTLDPTSDWVTR